MKSTHLNLAEAGTLLGEEEVIVELSQRVDNQKHKSKGQQALESRRAVEEFLDFRKLVKEFDYFDDEALIEIDY